MNINKLTQNPHTGISLNTRKGVFFTTGMGTYAGKRALFTTGIGVDAPQMKVFTTDGIGFSGVDLRQDKAQAGAIPSLGRGREGLDQA